MSQELAKDLVAICMMGGVVVWVERERAARLDELDSMPRNEWPQFIVIDGQKINPSRIEGMFDAKTMEDAARRKNGEWQCRQNNWHERFEKCECKDAESLKALCQRASDFYDSHGHWPLWAPSTHVIRKTLAV